MAIKNPELPRYGNWTTVEQARTCEEALLVVKVGWGEVNTKWRKHKEEETKRKEVDRISSGDLFTINLSKEGDGQKKGEIHGRTGGNIVKEDQSNRRNVRSGRSVDNKIAEEVLETNEVGLDLNECKYVETEVEPVESFQQDVASSGDCVYRVELPSEEEADRKALVLYEKKGITDVIENFSNLRLKREAMEELEAAVKKKRKIDIVEGSKQNAVACFAGQLRKAKVRSRRIAKKKKNKAVADGNRKGMGMGIVIAEGAGGWLEAASMEP